jgi:hypothetical protein
MSTPTIREKADRMAAYLSARGVFDTVERVGETGIRVSVWTWDEDAQTGTTLTGLIVVGGGPS